MIYGMPSANATAERTAKTSANVANGDGRRKLVSDQKLVWQEHPVFGSCGEGRWVKKEEGIEMANTPKRRDVFKEKSAVCGYQVAEDEQPYLHETKEEPVGKGGPLNNGYNMVHFTIQHSDREVLVALVDNLLAVAHLSSWRESWLFQDGVWQVVVNSTNE